VAARFTRDLLIVGGGPGAVGAITGFRKHHGCGDVVLVSSEATLPMLSKEFLRGDAGTEDLLVESPDFYTGVDVRLGTSVVALEPDTRLVTLDDGIEVQYSKRGTGRASNRRVRSASCPPVSPVAATL
jgi:3-phenylpropionate/trans-cinnamate dioxygenase ferredoxin reductase component